MSRRYNSFNDFDDDFANDFEDDFDDDFGGDPGQPDNSAVARYSRDDFSPDKPDDDDFENQLDNALTERRQGNYSRDDYSRDDYSSDDYSRDDYSSDDYSSDGYSRDGYNDDYNDADNDFQDDGFNDDLGSDDAFSDNGDFFDNHSNDTPYSEKDKDSKKLLGRLVVAAVAVVFAIGVLITVKISNSITNDDNGDNQGTGIYDNVTATDNPGGQTPEEVSSEPETSSQPDEPVSSEPVSSEPVYRELKLKEKSEDVKKMQQRLAELGYFPAGSCTGYYGPFTVEKLKLFQEKAGLEATGIADSHTLARLYADDAPRA